MALSRCFRSSVFLLPDIQLRGLWLALVAMLSIETAIVEMYKRRECSAWEALIEMNLAGVSIQLIVDIKGSYRICA
jgi:hypothetical protein